MSSVKERIIGAVTIMNEKDAEKIWEIIQSTFILSQADTTVPNADELAALSAKKQGDSDYCPAFTQEEVLKELGL